MADNLNYFSDDEESEWLASIDPSLLNKSNKEKQLNESEISSFIEENRNSNTTKKTKTDLSVWPGGGYSPKFRIGVCRERFQTLTLSKDKENEN